MSVPAPNSNGMYKFSVHGNSTISASVTTEFTAEDVAEAQGIELSEVDEDAIRDYASEQFYELAPNLCPQCSGWGREYSLEMSDVWEIEDDDIEKLDD